MRLIVLFVLFLSQITLASHREVKLKDYPFEGPYQSTLSAQAFFVAREKFDDLGKDLELHLFPNRPEMTYKLWLQPKPAPAIFLIPGFANHFRGNSALALANLLYKNGFNVIAVANPLNFGFSRPAMRAGIPGYSPNDARDLHYAFRAIIAQLNSKYPNQFLGYAVTGYSSGGLYTLFLADAESKAPQAEKIGFQAYVALNPPVDPAYSLDQIDDLYRIYTKWPEPEKKANYVNFITRISALEISTNEKDHIDIIRSLPDDTLKVAIGATFRLKLSALFQVAYVDGHLNELFDKGFLTDLKGTYSTWSRQEFYRTIEHNYNFHRYIYEAVVPYYQLRNPNADAKALLFNSSLYAIATELRTNPRIRVLHNADDIFMHNPESLKWLSQTLDSKLILFDKGGHVGNFYMSQVQSQIVQSMRSAFNINDAQLTQPSIYQIQRPL